VTRNRRGDAGFTLTEMLLSVGILGIIAPVIAGATVVGWQATDATIAHLKDTGNRQLVQAWFVRDSQSAKTVDTSSVPATCLSAGDTLVIGMRWADTVSSTTTINRAVAYVRTGTAPSYQLLRRACDDSSGSMDSQGSTTIARLVTAAPTATCNDSGGATVACASARQVTLTVTDASGSFTSVGRRRSL
jgi:prepilin-type N-terminal cleavage/methylation domain-containing protein